MTGKRVGFAVYDLKRGDFPLTLEMLDAVNRDVVWKVTAPGPGAVWIPGRSEVNQGRPVALRITTPDRVVVVEPISDG